MTKPNKPQTKNRNSRLLSASVQKLKRQALSVSPARARLTKRLKHDRTRGARTRSQMGSNTLSQLSTDTSKLKQHTVNRGRKSLLRAKSVVVKAAKRLKGSARDVSVSPEIISKKPRPGSSRPIRSCREASSTSLTVSSWTELISDSEDEEISLRRHDKATALALKNSLDAEHSLTHDTESYHESDTNTKEKRKKHKLSRKERHKQKHGKKYKDKLKKKLKKRERRHRRNKKKNKSSSSSSSVSSSRRDSDNSSSNEELGPSSRNKKSLSSHTDETNGKFVTFIGNDKIKQYQ